MTPTVLSGAAIVVVVLMVIRFWRPSKSSGFDITSKVSLPVVNNDGSSSLTGTAAAPDQYRKQRPIMGQTRPITIKKPAFKPQQYNRESLENMVSMAAIVGDFIMIAVGFIMAELLCSSHTIAARLHLHPTILPDPLSTISAGTLIVFWGLTGKNLYAYKNLLSLSRTWHKLIEPILLYLLAFIGISLLVRLDQQIPWAFYITATFLIFLNIYNWRLVLSRIIQHPALAARLRRRLVIIGGGSQTWRIKQALDENSDLEFIGWVQVNKPNHVSELEPYRLGSVHDLANILRDNVINVAILTESDSLQREGVLAVAKACEWEHTQFKMVPHFFDILISGLCPENIAGIQLLGVDALPLGGFRNQFLKRSVDIVGSLVGLSIAKPLIVIFGLLVYQESPGPILYRQLRQGRSGRLFHIIKIRSMHMNAEAEGKA